MAQEKQFIIKADDFGRGGSNLDPWRRFIECVLNKGLTASVGVVSLELAARKSNCRYLGSICDEYSFEIWNHSHQHKNFVELSSEQIHDDIAKSQQIITDNIGLRPRIFGPPFNKIDSHSAQCVIETGEFIGFYDFQEHISSVHTTNIEDFCTLEEGTSTSHPVRLRSFESNYSRIKNKNFLILQVHPYYWTHNCLLEFKKILTFLESQHFVSVTAEGRLSYLKFLEKTDSTEKKSNQSGFPQDNVRMALSKSDDDINFNQKLSIHHFFVEESPLGVQTINRALFFFKCEGFRYFPFVNGLIDILCMTSNIEQSWIKSLQFIEKSRVKLIELSENVNTQNMYEGDIYSLIFLDPLHQNFNLDDWLPLLRDRLVNVGGIYALLENRLMPIIQAINFIRHQDMNAAIHQLNSLVINEAYCANLIKLPPKRYLNGSEISFYAKNAGLKLQRSNIIHYPFLDSIFVRGYSGALLIKTSQSISQKTAGLSKVSINISPLLDEVVLSLAGENLLKDNFERQNNFKRILKDAGLIGDIVDPRRLDQIMFYASFRAMELGYSQLSYAFNDAPIYENIFNLYASIKGMDQIRIMSICNKIELSLEELTARQMEYWL